jgi:hypothetical protein
MDTKELHSNAYERMTAVQLRKAAQGRVKNANRLRKADLVTALIEFDAKEQRNAEANKALEETIAAQSAAFDEPQPTKTIKEESEAITALINENKPRKAKKRCEACGKRPVDRKTQGADSTMCEPCFEYAGWENTHVDNDHTAYAAGEYVPETTERAVELVDEIKQCPVCQGADPADKPAKKNGSKPGRKVAKQPERKQGQTKGQKFAEEAKANGWKVQIEDRERGHLEIVTASRRGGEFIQIQWRDGACLNTGTTHRRADGKRVKVRNASAARKIIQD